jgi:N-acetylglucosamine kinase-like BadF-type ATPase
MFYRHCVCSESTGRYVVGVDAGGTHTRAAIVTLDGVVAAHGSGPGANPNSGGDTARALTTALTAALGATDPAIDPALIVGGVFGIAGAGAAGRARIVTAAGTAWRAAGLTGAPDVVTDIAVAYAAGTTEPAGIVVFAGTGAGAAVIDDGEIERRADAYGWLIGDEGSAVWIGREAVRAAMRAYDRRGPATVLAETVPRALLGEAAEPLLAELPPGVLPGLPPGVLPGTAGEGPASGPALPQAIVREVYSGPPAALGGLAPLVSAAAEEGDEVARRIAAEAAECLLNDVDAVRPALAGHGPGHGLVVAGSLLERGPVADAVRSGLRERFGTDPSPAGEGTAGAARLAIRRLRSRRDGGSHDRSPPSHALAHFPKLRPNP